MNLLMLAAKASAMTQALELMVFGMGGVFLVLLVLYLICLALFKLFPGDTSKK